MASPSLRRNIIRTVVWMLVAAAAVVGGLQVYHRMDAAVKDFDLAITPPSIPADGVSSALLEIRIISRFGNRMNVRALPEAPTIELVEGGDLVKVVPLGDSLSYRLVARFNSGRVVVRAKIFGAPGPIEATLDLTPSLADRNRNGYPDVMDLSSDGDRTAFRRWFTTIALAQLTHIDDRWNDRDCAGLLRYCYREALKRHDNAWLADRRWLVTAAIPDVRKYNYPNVPLVGTRLFNAGHRTAREGITGHDPAMTPVADHPARARMGQELTLDEFSDFAEAARLKDNSLAFLGRDRDGALPGDVMVYLNDTESQWPYHTMIYLGNGMTVYHTGPDGDKPGIVKRLSLAQLAAHPNPRWHPVAENPYFLGFYRWRILM
jgi:uncharacterized protein YfaT (DUF1175 family)